MADSDLEQVEELQRWWKENGRSVVTGIVLGLAAVFGWNGWQRYQQGQREEASARYEQLMQAVNEERSAQALARAKSIIQDYPGTQYAALAALLAAREALAGGDAAEAQMHLRWVIDNADGQALKDLARLRLARLMLDAGKPAEAERLAAAIETPSYRSLAAEVEGDARLARGDSQGARSAYRAALDLQQVAPATRQRIQVKLDDLGEDSQWPGTARQSG